MSVSISSMSARTQHVFTLLLVASFMLSMALAAPSAVRRQTPGPDEIKGISPAAAPIAKLTAHPFESLCAEHKGLSLSGGGLAPTNCGLPYEALPSRANRGYCSGLLSASLPGMICGACLEVEYKNKKTHVRYVDQSEGAFDISYTNYVDIADTEDYAKSEKLDGTRSGAHTNPLVGATYKEVHGSLCDAYWDGRCSNMILPNYPGANRPMEYSCVP